MICQMLRAISVVVLLLGVCGCVTTKTNPDRPKSYTTQVRDSSTGSTTGTSEKPGYFDVDNCADRLHTIEGQIVLYYARFHRLPAALTELRAFADPGDDVSYTCPVSHQSYVYVSTGLVFGTDPRRLIVYDATPAHNGGRWGILFSPAKGRQPLTTTVIPIPESSMKGFVPAPPIAQPLTTMPAAPSGQK
jgi:hypothetical protein